jgi:hypothetical protein
LLKLVCVAVEYELLILSHDQPLNAVNDNVDVEVQVGDGSRWSATFFTLDNIDALFAKNRITGECANGLYLWAADMILVERLDESAIRATVDALRQSGEFSSAFGRIDP